jgi:hypothetical protein
MSVRLLLLLGAPRSGTTMLERVLSSHSMIHGGPEPHLLTPLAHLGVWANVDKAPYDHIVAALGQKDFVARLPGGEGDYFAACRAYSEALYAKGLEGSGKSICLDKTPEYATVLPFIAKVWPDAKYVVLTRHPVAVFSSFANSFFDGRFDIAESHDPVINRYVPALASFLRQRDVPFVHVRYEDFVEDPARWLEKICEYVGVPFEPGALDYASKAAPEAATTTSGRPLGDPIGVKRHSRPSSESLHKWADELAADPAKLALTRAMVEKVAPEDFATIGYPLDSFWAPLDERLGAPASPNGRPRALDRYALERKAIVHGRALVQKSDKLRGLLNTVRLTCDVLLREY